MARHKLLIATTIALFSVALPAAAETLPFSLDGFHWRMTSAEARQHYPALGPQHEHPADFPLTDQNVILVGPYAWKDCVFDLSFNFATVDSQELLAGIDVTERQNGSPACADEMRRELRAQFGEADSSGTLIVPSDAELVWETPESRYDKAHPDEVARRYQGMNAMDRFMARAKSGRGAKARFVVSPWGPRAFLFAPGMPGRITFN